MTTGSLVTLFLMSKWLVIKSAHRINTFMMLFVLRVYFIEDDVTGESICGVYSSREEAQQNIEAANKMFDETAWPHNVCETIGFEILEKELNEPITIAMIKKETECSEYKKLQEQRNIKRKEQDTADRKQIAIALEGTGLKNDRIVNLLRPLVI